jgi:hypothetical protein
MRELITGFGDSRCMGDGRIVRPRQHKMDRQKRQTGAKNGKGMEGAERHWRQ